MSNPRYNYIEIIDNIGKRYPNLDVANSTNPKLKIFRILSGSCNCQDDLHSQVFNLRNNYFQLPSIPNESPIVCDTLLMNFEDLSLSDMNQYFSNSHNHNFFTKLHGECLKCLISHHLNKEIEAFVHLYRILECISYSFPLIYAAKAKEFLSTYELLQKIMAESNSELKFFKRFINEIYKEEDFFSTTFDLKFDCIKQDEERVKLYKLLEDIARRGKIDIYESTENEELKFYFLQFYSLLITIRNRYFHLSQGGWADNISCKDTEYPELLFELIVDKGINWVAIIIFEILKFDMTHCRA